MPKKMLSARLLFSSLSPLVAALGAAAAFGPACVTVNVNFPEAAVQQATDDYVQDLYRAREKGRATPAAPNAGPSAKPDAALQPPAPRASTQGAWRFALVSEAWAADEFPAAEMKIKVGSPKSMTIRDRQIGRLDQVNAAKAAGQVGESNDGLLVVDPGNQLKPAARAAAQALADSENKDRKDLYNEVLVSNGYPKTRLIDLQKSFARSFQSHSESGTWTQSEAGKWSRKP